MRIEKEIQWNRKDVENVISTDEHRYKRYPAKAKLLKQHMKTFENIDISSIVECLHYQRKHQESVLSMCVRIENKEHNKDIMSPITKRKSPLRVAQGKAMNSSRENKKLKRLINKHDQKQDKDTIIRLEQELEALRKKYVDL